MNWNSNWLARSRIGKVVVIIFWGHIGMVTLLQFLDVNPDSAVSISLMNIAYQLGLTSICLVAARITLNEWDDVKLPKLSEPHLWLFYGLLMFGLALGYNGISAFLQAVSGLETQHSTVTHSSRPWASSSDAVFYFASVALVAPVAEEVVYRILLLHPYVGSSKFHFQALLSSLLFGIVHGVEQFGIAFILGIFLAYLYQARRTIWPCVASHSVFNIAVSVQQVSKPEWLECNACSNDSFATWWPEFLIFFLSTSLLMLFLHSTNKSRMRT